MGPTGSGKTRLALALRRLAPTAVVDVAQITASGHEGMPLSIAVRALLRETNGLIEQARFGIVVLDNLDCWLAGHSDIHRRNLWWELLMYLEGCTIQLSSKGAGAAIETDNILFVGLLRTRSSPPEIDQTRFLIDLGLPEPVVARMSVKVFLPSPDAEALAPLLDVATGLEEYGLTGSARRYLAEKAAAKGLGALGVRHVLSELELQLGLEDRQPKRIDRRFLERRFGKLE